MNASDLSSQGTASGPVRVFEDRTLIVFDVRFLPSGDTFAHVGLSTIWFRNAVTGAIEHELTVPKGAGSLGAWAVSPRGDRILWGSTDTGLHLFDLSGRLLRRLTLPKEAERFLTDESPGLGSFVEIIHADGTCEDLSIRYPAYLAACDVTFSPDGTMCAAAHGQVYATLWDLEDGRLRCLLGREEHDRRHARIRSVAWAPDGGTVMTRDDRGVVRLWDVETREEVLRVEGRIGPRPAGVDSPDDMPASTGALAGLGAIAFTPDSRHVAAGDGEVVRLWRVGTGREAATWVGHGARHWGLDYPPRILAIRFSADGERALTIGVDSALRVWDVPSGTELWSVIPPACCVEQADINPEGRRVIWAGCRGMRMYEVG
jgi:WD40 repeat protein